MHVVKTRPEEFLPSSISADTLSRSAAIHRRDLDPYWKPRQTTRSCAAPWIFFIRHSPAQQRNRPHRDITHWMTWRPRVVRTLKRGRQEQTHMHGYIIYYKIIDIISPSLSSTHTKHTCTALPPTLFARRLHVPTICRWMNVHCLIARPSSLSKQHVTCTSSVNVWEQPLGHRVIMLHFGLC